MKITEKILSIDGTNSTLTGYILDNFHEIDMNRRRPAILIAPGGAYGWVSKREGEAVAVRFSAMGFQTFVLDYPVAPAVRYPMELAHAMLAVKTIRRSADEWHVDSEKIAALGFSAGGHLIANLSCDFDNPEAAKLAGVDKGEARPDAAVLCYPVISSGEFAHRGSIENLLGEKETPELLLKVSLEKQVTENNPPTFIWHTFEDGSVPVQNSLLFASALREKNVTCEMHIFPFGHHGLSLCTYETEGNKNLHLPEEAAVWPDLCGRFLKQVFGIGV